MWVKVVMENMPLVNVTPSWLVVHQCKSALGLPAAANMSLVPVILICKLVPNLIMGLEKVVAANMPLVN